MGIPSTRRDSETANRAGVLVENQFIVVGAGQVQKRKGIDDLSVWLRNCPDYLYLGWWFLFWWYDRWL